MFAAAPNMILTLIVIKAVYRKLCDHKYSSLMAARIMIVKEERDDQLSIA